MLSLHAQNATVGILGAGTWGISLARMLANTGKKVTVWSKIEKEIDELKKTNTHPKLPGIVLPKGIHYTSSIKEALTDKNIVVFAVPSVFVRSTAKEAKEYIPNGQILVSVVKGIEADTLMTMTEVIDDELKNPTVHYVALSGPTHAEEVAVDIPTAIVSACEDEEIAKYVQKVFTSSFMRVYTNTDIRGIEICGAVKNVLALAAGISNGLGYGDNTKAAIITRGLAELARLGGRIGCTPHTFSGLAGLGDLVVTATSPHSRNNRAGYLIGEGKTPKEAVKEVGMVVEGINALPAAMKLSQVYGVEMPIVSTVNDIINNEVKPLDAVNALLNREQKTELPTEDKHANPRTQAKNNTKAEGLKVVITYGNFDLLSYKLIDFLRRAKALGDYLIVGLSTDEFSRDEKQCECHFDYEERKAFLEAVKYVDLIIPEKSWTQKKEDIKKYHVDILALKEGWDGLFDYVKDDGVKAVVLPAINTKTTPKEI